MFTSDEEMILKIKSMSEKEKKDLADKLDEWTVSRVENYVNRKFEVGDISLKNIDGLHNALQMDNIYLYHYLLGKKIYLERLPEEYRQERLSNVLGEVYIKDYTHNGTVIKVLCMISMEEYESLYKDIVVEE